MGIIQQSHRYAVKIKPAEQVILEEDDAAAILTRRLVETYTIFKKKNALSTTAKSGKKSLNKGFSIPSSDVSSFTTLVCLYQITQIIIESKNLNKNGIIKRPSNSELEKLWIELKEFWDDFFNLFPETVAFIDGKPVPDSFRRSHESGGSILLRPEGQFIISQIYKKYKTEDQLDFFKNNIIKIDLNLSSPIWIYVFWKVPGIETGNKKLKKSLFLYLLGDLSKKKEVEEGLVKIYKKYNLDYTNHITPIV